MTKLLLAALLSTAFVNAFEKGDREKLNTNTALIDEGKTILNVYFRAKWDNVAQSPVVNFDKVLTPQHLKHFYTNLSLIAHDDPGADRAGVGRILNYIDSLGAMDSQQLIHNNVPGEQIVWTANMNMYQDISLYVAPAARRMLDKQQAIVRDYERGASTQRAYFFIGLGGLAACAWWWYKGNSSSMLNTLFKCAGTGLSSVGTCAAYLSMQKANNRFICLRDSVINRLVYFRAIEEHTQKKVAEWKMDQK